VPRGCGWNKALKLAWCSWGLLSFLELLERTRFILNPCISGHCWPHLFGTNPLKSSVGSSFSVTYGACATPERGNPKVIFEMWAAAYLGEDTIMPHTHTCTNNPCGCQRSRTRLRQRQNIDMDYGSMAKMSFDSQIVNHEPTLDLDQVSGTDKLGSNLRLPSAHCFFT